MRQTVIENIKRVLRRTVISGLQKYNLKFKKWIAHCNLEIRARLHFHTKNKKRDFYIVIQSKEGGLHTVIRW
jgi:hypothetical protein